MPTDAAPSIAADADAALTDDAARLEWRRAGLSARSRRVIRAAAEAMFCDRDDDGELYVPATGVCDRAVDGLDRMLAAGSADLRRGFAVLTFVLELLPPFVVGALSRMSRLSLDERVRFLEALESSRIGLLAMLFVAIKVPMSIPALEEGEELARTGFDRPSTTSRRRLPVAGPRASTARPVEEAAS